MEVFNTMEEGFREIEDLKFSVHGLEYSVKDVENTPETSLLEFLREKRNLKGTKMMCREGGCGVCVVSVTANHPVTKKSITFSVNSCLVPIFSCTGWQISTSEGIGNRKDGFHPIQSTLVKYNGTQCGFCSNGMVMNMYALQKSGKLTAEEIENSFGGNLCRCTGYRPILDAFKSMAVEENSDDIEDLPKCKSENCEKNCPTPCGRRILHLGESIWYKVNTIPEIFKTFTEIGNKTYKLVAGSTAQGVYRDMAKAEVYIDVSGVVDLRKHEMNTNSLILGGGVTLTETMDIFNNAAKNDSDFLYLKTMVEHIDIVAHVSVRNIGTIAGNLSIKHKHNEFQSDIFLLLEAVGATIIIVDSAKKETKLSPIDYLTTDMNRKVIKAVSLPPLGSNYKFQSYKIMPRAQNAHAIVNAGFLFKFDNSNNVQSARIVYGGINPQFVHASNAETFLIGKNLFQNSVMQQLFDKLNDEIKPVNAPPEPSPQFRKELAIALCYKCILSIAPNVSDRNKSGGEKLKRPLSKGTQDYTPSDEMKPLGQPIEKLEALAQVSGEAEYIIDQPELPHQLHAFPILAKAKTYSKILNVDASEALKLKGVVSFVDKDDIPGVNNYAYPGFEIEEIFCSGIVKYHSQLVGLILAETHNIAETAADLVKITYEESDIKPYYYIKDILENNVKDKIFNSETIVPKKTGTNIKKTVSGEIRLSWQYHFHMENQNCNVVPREDNEYDVYAGTQWMDLAQTTGAIALGLPVNKINVYVRRLGGAFGAKISRNALISCAALVAAHKVKRPVKFWMTLSDNMRLIGKRNPIYSKFTNKVDEKGVIQDLHLETYTDYGLAGNDAPLSMTKELILKTYNSDAYLVDIYYTKSDNSACTWTRSPGSTEGLAMIENVMEQTAYALNIDPLDLRIANLNNDHPKLLEFVNSLKEWANIDQRKTDIKKFNEENRWRKRGISVIPMTYKLIFEGTQNVILSIYQADGSVAISHGGIEMGQGINTKAVQAVAHFLNIPMDMISCKIANNLVSPNNLTTGGSITSEAVCLALYKCCEEILARMDPIKKKNPNKSWAEIVQLCYQQQIDLCTTSMYASKTTEDYYIYGVTAAEVLVDLLTGNYLLTRVDLLEDTGNSLNPIIDLGQIEGAYVMGIGYYTSEEIKLNKETGELLTNRTWTYKPPGVKDIPVEFNVKFPKDNPNPSSPLKGKATAEPPLCMSFGVALAIRQALKAARADADPSAPSFVPIDGPTTVECTFMNSLNNYKQYTL